MTDVALVDTSHTQAADHSNLALVLFYLLPVHEYNMKVGHFLVFKDLHT